MGRSRKKGRQITIEDVLGRAAQFRASVSSPITKEVVAVDNADSDDDDDDDELPIQRTGRKRKAPAGANSSPVANKSRRSPIVGSDDEEEEEADSDDTADMLPRRPSSKPVTVSDDDDSDDDDDDDDDVRPAKRLRRGRQPSADSDGSSDDDLVILTPPPKQTPSRLVRSTPVQQQQAASSRSARKSGARSARQRHMELLRRRRLGEKVTESDLEDPISEEDEPRVALYDKDPDHVALSDFEDDEEEEEKEKEEEEAEPVSAEQMEKDLKKKWKKDKKKEKKEKKRRKAEREQEQFSAVMQLRSKYDEESDDGYNILALGEGEVDDEEEEEAEDMADFIDDSHTGLLGAPDGSDAEDEQAMLRREMPLQFTFQAHKPLKSHFKDAIEWLVHRRVNPGGVFAESDDELYKVAWDRLDREVGGLAQSRFISSVWTSEFYGTLRARPYMDSFNIRPSGGSKDSIAIPGMEENVCHACGRTNHPASFRVMFSGKAYDSKTLDDIEEADSDEDEDEDDQEDHESIDMNGNALPPTSRQWYVGVVCHSNAETAHDLLHWRRALKDWVEEKLKADRLLDGLEGRKKKMKSRKRRAFANKIVDDWEANSTVNSLFRDFSKMLEGAQAKSTKTLSRFGR